MKVNVILNVGSWYSFRYVANLFKDFLLKHYNINAEISYGYKEGYHNILIEDTWNSILRGDIADVYWTDTANPVKKFQKFYLDVLNRNKDKVFEVNYAVSKSNENLMKLHGIRVDDVIPRLINDMFFSYNCNGKKKYDIVFIGNLDHCDRKNVKMALDTAIKLRLKSIFLIPRLPSWYRSIPSYIRIAKYGSLTDEQKAEIISKSKYLLWLSFYEGFGMPVVESMALGVPIIYTDCPSHSEFAIGFSIKPEKEYTTYCYGTWISKRSFNFRDIRRTILSAMEISKDEYQDLAERCIDKALEIYNTFVDKSELLLG